ncbi:peptide/nickel transport system permease protein [Tamaricihabitans halophyticus]|uniref:Peptide/nickel transport system permease protein n=1 Tax=Tamaricihabitans halophyticus TaxID=1262583 RepID=A0A4R2QL46_9PSEU|nr:ABC transporter permease [Tamaricihabitans halophyticus]TCP50067.1 peptide/nickel transport system permease protein [Tamaricihabitans halophyticus]
MITYALRRIAMIIPLIIMVSFGVYALVLMIPGDPAITIAGENATEEQIQATRERLGLTDSFFVQYWNWISGAVRGDLGQSLFSSQTVTGAILDRFPVTLALTAAAVTVALLIAVPAGIIAALHRGRWPDRAVTLLTSIGISMPSFWLGILLVMVLALATPIFPAVGYTPLSESVLGWAHNLVLPAFTLGLAVCAEITRQLRGSLSDVLHQDYIRTARAAGLRGRIVVVKHGMKNAAVPVVTVLGFQVGFLLGGSVVVERVFGIPGLGDLAIRAVLERDIPMIQGIVVVSAAIVMLVNLVVDLSYGYLNPKVRQS